MILRTQRTLGAQAERSTALVLLPQKLGVYITKNIQIQNQICVIT